MTDASHSLPANVLDAIQRGNPIEAIKLLRDQTGIGLKEAKDLVDEHIRGGAAATARQWSGTLPAFVEEALQRGNKIEAIRLLRKNETGHGLKEAKDAVEAAPKQRSANVDLHSPGEVPRSGSALWWLVACAIIVAVVVYVALLDAA